MAPLIKSLAEKYLSFREKKGKIIRENEGKRPVRQKREKAVQRKADRRKIEERRRIKRLFCVELETHFLVRG